MNREEKFSVDEIIEKVINGEKSLYELIVRRFDTFLYKIGRSYNYNHADTQDLMQDTFVDAYKNLSSFQGRSSFKTWIVRIMLNNCYQRKRKSRYKTELTTDVEDNVRPIYAQSNINTGKVIHNMELKQIIEDALSHIPQDYRMVFSMREINGFNVRETADLLKISESNVKVRLHRAKSMLRKEIEKDFSPRELFEFNLIYCDALVENVMQRIKEL